MTLKLILLQTGEQIIADIREVFSDEKSVGYLFKNPELISVAKSFFKTEQESDKDNSVEVTLTPWMILSSDKEILISKSYVVTILEPIESLKNMYTGKVNGISN